MQTSSSSEAGESLRAAEADKDRISASTSVSPGKAGATGTSPQDESVSGTVGEEPEEEEPDPRLQALELRSISHGVTSLKMGSNTQGAYRSRRSFGTSQISTVDDDEWSAPGSDAGTARLRHPELRLRRQVPRCYDPIARFWRRQVSVYVDIDTRRDHLALERTFLAYMRTSLALSMVGVITAQLFRLQHGVNPSSAFGYFALGIPLASAFNGAALVVVLLGAWRFWRQQNALVRGKVYAGGWEVLCIMGLSILLCLLLFTTTLAVDINTLQ